MKPILKKICRERGIEPNPRSFQENSWEATRCPNCQKPLHKNSKDNSVCDHCGNVYQRNGWELIQIYGKL